MLIIIVAFIQLGIILLSGADNNSPTTVVHSALGLESGYTFGNLSLVHKPSNVSLYTACVFAPQLKASVTLRNKQKLNNNNLKEKR